VGRVDAGERVAPRRRGEGLYVLCLRPLRRSHSTRHVPLRRNGRAVSSCRGTRAEGLTGAAAKALVPGRPSFTIAGRLHRGLSSCQSTTAWAGALVEPRLPHLRRLTHWRLGRSQAAHMHLDSSSSSLAPSSQSHLDSCPSGPYPVPASPLGATAFVLAASGPAGTAPASGTPGVKALRIASESSWSLHRATSRRIGTMEARATPPWRDRADGTPAKHVGTSPGRERHLRDCEGDARGSSLRRSLVRLSDFSPAVRLLAP